MKTLWLKEKMLVTSILSFYHNFFCHCKGKSCVLSNCWVLRLQMLLIWRSTKACSLVKLSSALQLYLSQTTNFGLFHTQRVCRRQFFLFHFKGRKFSKVGTKHCGKRRNCSLRAISPVPTVFSKDL